MTLSQTPLTLEYVLLGFLCQGSDHGYSLHKKITGLEAISLVWNIKQSYFYALLEKLEGAGLLTSQMVLLETHRSRKVFEVTPLGRQLFLEWAAIPVRHGRDMRQEFLAKVYFARRAGHDSFYELVDKQIAECDEWLTSLQVSASQTTPEQFDERMIFQYRIYQTQATLEWLKTCRIEFQSLSHSKVEP